MARSLRAVAQTTQHDESQIKPARKGNSTVAFHRLRLIGGFALIGLSAVLGYLLIDNGNETANHIVMSRNLAAGSLITAQDFEIRSAPLSMSESYTTADHDIVGQRLGRDVFAGEYLPLNAVVQSGSVELRTLSIPIAAGHAPVVSSGELVDVWMTPSVDGIAEPGPASLVFESAVVESGNQDQDPSIDSVVTVTVPFEDVHKIVDAVQYGVVSLVQVQGNQRGMHESTQ